MKAAAHSDTPHQSSKNIHIETEVDDFLIV